MAFCELCQGEEARYVCSDCGRRVGLLCFEREGWLCKSCAKGEIIAPKGEEISRRVTIATVVLFFALALIFAGSILLTLSAPSTGQGNLVVVFPFFFASSGSPGALVIPTIVLIVIMILIAYLNFRKVNGK